MDSLPLTPIYFLDKMNLKGQWLWSVTPAENWQFCKACEEAVGLITNPVRFPCLVIFHLGVCDRSYAESLCIVGERSSRRNQEGLLLPKGNLVVKLLESEELPSIRTAMRSHFATVDLFRPDATRRASREIYLVGRRRRRLISR